MLEGRQYALGHTAKLCVERKSENVDLGFAFIRVERGVPTVSQAQSLLVNLKHESRN